MAQELEVTLFNFFSSILILNLHYGFAFSTVSFYPKGYLHVCKRHIEIGFVCLGRRKDFLKERMKTVVLILEILNFLQFLNVRNSFDSKFKI